MPKDKRAAKRERERKAWHPAFAEATMAELADYRDVLEFETEHPLITEPQKIDLLIIKKTADVEIEKNIGAIFRQHNIVEYKSPGVTLSVAVYNKVMAYTHLYMSLEKVQHTDMTMTFVSYRHPVKLIKHLKDAGSAIEQRYPGILYVTGPLTAIPTQLIVSRKLDEDENLWLRNLSNELKRENARKVLDEGLSSLEDKAKMRAYIDILMRSNSVMGEEAERMARTRNRSFEEILEETGYIAEWKSRAKIEVAIAYVNDGDSVEHAAKMAGIPAEELEGYLQ
jgi:hypothetical protein